MKYDAQKNQFTLSTGKAFYAHGGVLGVAAGAAWEGGARRVETAFTDVEKWEVIEEIMTSWFEWASIPNARGLAQLAISFGDHVRPTQKPIGDDQVVISKTHYAALLDVLAASKAAGRA